MNAKVLLGFFAGGAVVGVLMFFVMRPAAPKVAPLVATAQVEAPAAEPPVPAPLPAAQPGVAPAPPVEKPAPRRLAEKRVAEKHVAPASTETAKVAPAKPAPAEPAPAPAAEPAKNAEAEYKSNPALDHARAQRVPPPPDEAEQRATAAPAAAPAPPRKPNTVTLKDGTLFNVRLAEKLSSERQASGDTFWATLDEPVVAEGFVIAERGARVEGKVVNAVRAGRVKGTAELSLQLTRLRTADGQNVDIKTVTFTKEGPKSVKEDAVKVGVGSAIGAAIGAIAGGGRGAAIGAATGGAAGGGYVLTQRGKPAELPVETRLSFRLEVPLTLTERVK